MQTIRPLILSLITHQIRCDVSLKTKHLILMFRVSVRLDCSRVLLNICYQHFYRIGKRISWSFSDIFRKESVGKSGLKNML